MSDPLLTSVLSRIAALPPPSLDEWSAIMQVVAELRHRASECGSLEHVYTEHIKHFQNTMRDVDELQASNAELRAQISAAGVPGLDGMSPPVSNGAAAKGLDRITALRAQLSVAGVQRPDGMSPPLSNGSAAKGLADDRVAAALRETAPCNNDCEIHGVPFGATTLVARNLPSKCCQDVLLQMWPPQACAINYLYLPFNIKQRRQAGYCFLNFCSWEAADAFFKIWHLREFQDIAGRSKQLQLKVASLQGVEANLRHLKAENIEGVLNDRYVPVVLDEACRPLDFRALVASLPSERGLQEAGPRTGLLRIAGGPEPRRDGRRLASESSSDRG